MVKPKRAETYDLDDIRKCFALLVSNTQFLRKFMHLLDAENQTDLALRWTMKSIEEYTAKYDRSPSFEILNSLFRNDTRLKPDQKELIVEFLEDLPKIKPKKSQIDYYATVFENFLRRTYIRRILFEADELLRKGNHEEAENKLLDMKVPVTSDGEIAIFPDDIATIFAQDAEDIAERTVPTGVKELDRKLKGGLRPGELGVALAPTGFGKSMWLVHVAANAWREGRNVIHFSFENSTHETLLRYIANVLQDSSDSIMESGTNSKYIQSMQAKASENSAVIAVERLIGGTTDSKKLEAEIFRLQDEYNFDAQLVVVDYGDLMRPIRYNEKTYESQKAVFSELRDLASTVDLPLWTATQSNREGLERKRVKLSDISESLGKAMTADVILGISRPQKEAAQESDEDDVEVDGDPAELKLLKLRRGADDRSPVTVFTNFAQARFEEASAEEAEVRFDESLKNVLNKRKKSK